MVSWFKTLVELLVGLSGNHVAGSGSDVNEARERKRRRDYEAWHKKHGSKMDKKQ